MAPPSFPKLHSGPCSSLGMRPGTDRHTDGRGHYTFCLGYASRELYQLWVAVTNSLSVESKYQLTKHAHLVPVNSRLRTLRTLGRLVLEKYSVHSRIDIWPSSWLATSMKAMVFRDPEWTTLTVVCTHQVRNCITIQVNRKQLIRVSLLCGHGIQLQDRHPFNCLFYSTTWVSQHQKG